MKTTDFGALGVSAWFCFKCRDQSGKSNDLIGRRDMEEKPHGSTEACL